MSSTFNPQILMEKLAKLNGSQQNIETLSHWCIFHMNKARNVVETWARQFNSSPREQRLAFLYLSNDILKNSRRKGSEFVGEFWKVLPDALHDVIENGDEFARSSALRLINIWDERKVFGSRGQFLMEELVGKKLNTNNRNGNPPGLKLRNTAGNLLDKIVSGYEVAYGGQPDDEAIFSKCRNAISSLEKVDKEIGGDIGSVQLNDSSIVEEIKGQNAMLMDCIELLKVMESSKANLLSHLRQALQEEEFKLDQVRNQLRAAHSHSARASNLCRQFLSHDRGQLVGEQNMKETHISRAPESYMERHEEQTPPVMYTQQVPYNEKSGHLEEAPKSAAAVAAKLTASTSSAQVLTYVLSSLASEGVINNPTNESSNDCPPEKKPKLENDQFAYAPSQNTQPQGPPFVHPDSLKHNVSVTSKELSIQLEKPLERPPLPSSPPPMPPLLPMQPYPIPPFMQNAGPIPGVPYGYGAALQPLQILPPYSTSGVQFSGISRFAAPPANSYQGYQAEGAFYSQQSSLPMAPISRP